MPVATEPALSISSREAGLSINKFNDLHGLQGSLSIANLSRFRMIRSLSLPTICRAAQWKMLAIPR